MSGRCLSAALVFTGLLASSAFAPAEDCVSAKKFVVEVYAGYANPDVRHQQERQRNFYTSQLYRMILADEAGHPGYAGKLDSDPICDCQDPGDPGELKVRSVVFSTLAQDRIKANVSLAIVTDQRKVVLTLLKTPSGWRIDDISTEGMSSLRNLLRAPSSPPSNPRKSFP